MHDYERQLLIKKFATLLRVSEDRITVQTKNHANNKM